MSKLGSLMSRTYTDREGAFPDLGAERSAGALLAGFRSRWEGHSFDPMSSPFAQPADAPEAAAGYPATFDLAKLDGDNGIRLVGIDEFDNSGFAVSGAGDVNGDGLDDVIIGAFDASHGGRSGAGESYVVFGRADGIPASFDLAKLDGSQGFRLDGIDAGDNSGFSVSDAGDVNGDGFDDIIIGASRADGGDTSAGESYVVFGKADGFAPIFDLATLDGTNGFRIDGADFRDYSGDSVSSAGDVNGDGFDDIIIGAPDVSAGAYSSGVSYVVFDKAGGRGGSIDLATLDGTNGFRIDGVDRNESSGNAVSSAGDINGDGFDDIIIGAPGRSFNGFDPGESYVVFGKAGGFAATLDLATLDGTNGFRIDAVDKNDSMGGSVASAGDVNGDGFDDIIIGARRANSYGDLDAGESYVVFGKADGFAATFDLATLDGSNGFRLDGVDGNDQSGGAVSGAGDVNGDGFDDIIVGASGAYSGGYANGFAGQTYIVFGKAGGFDATLDLATLDGSNGIRLDGIDGRDYSGTAVSAAGDVNGDGFDDIIIGADGADRGSDAAVGETYVVFGRPSDPAVTGVGWDASRALQDNVFVDIAEARIPVAAVPDTPTFAVGDFMMF